MVRIGKKEKNDRLYQAILQLKDPQECYDFFQDLCTVSELRSMEQRFEVASLLNDGMIYSDILEQLFQIVCPPPVNTVGHQAVVTGGQRIIAAHASGFLSAASSSFMRANTRS